MFSFILLIIFGLFNYSCATYVPKNEKIIICGVCKNVAQALPNMMRKIDDLGKSFKDYRVFIYENNSADNTVKLLNKWAQKNPKVIIFSEYLTYEQLYQRTKAHTLGNRAPNRMELIAYGRNKTLEQALSPEFNDFNFVIMMDMDFTIGWNIKGVLSCFDANIEWDCMTANGIDKNGIYVDRYTYRDEQFTLGPDLIGPQFWSDLGKTWFKIDVNSELRKVIAAFGGIAIYKKEAIKNCRSSGYITKDYEKLMNQLVNKLMHKNHPQYQLYKKIINSNEEILPIKFQTNCDFNLSYDIPVVCDHSPLQASMILQGFDKIYINPAMVCIYP